jgi:hypothetical protein
MSTMWAVCVQCFVGMSLKSYMDAAWKDGRAPFDPSTLVRNTVNQQRHSASDSRSMHFISHVAILRAGNIFSLGLTSGRYISLLVTIPALEVLRFESSMNDSKCLNTYCEVKYSDVLKVGGPPASHIFGVSRLSPFPCFSVRFSLPCWPAALVLMSPPLTCR